MTFINSFSYMIDKRDFMRRVKTYFHETMIFAYYLLIFQMPNIMHEIDIVAPVMIYKKYIICLP